jgi:hypothetical protein
MTTLRSGSGSSFLFSPPLSFARSRHTNPARDGSGSAVTAEDDDVSDGIRALSFTETG